MKKKYLKIGVFKFAKFPKIPKNTQRKQMSPKDIDKPNITISDDITKPPLQLSKGEFTKAEIISEELTKKVPSAKIVVNIDADDLAFYQYNQIDIGNLDIDFWERVNEEFYEEIKNKIENGSLIATAYPSEGYVQICCKKDKEKDTRKFLNDIFSKFFNGRLFDGMNQYRTVNIDDLPAMSNIENYRKQERDNYNMALEGMSNSDNFRLIIVGSPGTGKTYYAKICSRYLIEKKNVDSVLLDNIWRVKRLLTFLNNIKSKIKLLFVVDEMETHTMARNQGGIEKGTDRMLQFLDGLSSFENIRLIGITNLPQLIDKAIFRPGRIDMIIISSPIKNDKERLVKIFKSLSKTKYNIEDGIIDKLADAMAEKFTKEFPISFYTHAMKLYNTYRDLDKVMEIMKVFGKHKSLYSYNMGEEIDVQNQVGFVNEEDEDLPRFGLR